MKRHVFAALGALLQLTMWAQQQPLSELDSLFWVPFQHDSLAFSHRCWVEHAGQTGALLMSDEAWAWQPDTAQPVWTFSLPDSPSLQQLDLSAERGTVIAPPPHPAPAPNWQPTATEGRTELGDRFRVFESNGAAIEVRGLNPSDASLLPSLAGWHRFLKPDLALAPLPGKTYPIAFKANGQDIWRFAGCRTQSNVVLTRGGMLFDPNRTLMDAVREKQAAEGQR